MSDASRQLGHVPNSSALTADRLLRRVRWVSIGLTTLQFALYSPPIGVDLPFSRWWGAVPVAVLAVVNVVGVMRRRQGRAPSERWAMAQLVWDCLITVVIMIFGVTLFFNLARALLTPHKVRFACPTCGLQRHDSDAVHCKACGNVLNIPDEGLT